MKSMCWDRRATDLIIKSGPKDPEASIAVVMQSDTGVSLTANWMEAGGMKRWTHTHTQTERGKNLTDSLVHP